MKIRNTSETIKRGIFKDLTKNDGCFVYEREPEKENGIKNNPENRENEKFVVAINFDKAGKVVLPDFLSEKTYEPILYNYKTTDKFSENFEPFEARVFKKIK